MFVAEQLQPGEVGVIQAVHAEKSLHQRLTAMGFHVGKPITLVRRANFNGPLHLRLGSTDVIMRSEDAKLIELRQAA